MNMKAILPALSLIGKATEDVIAIPEKAKITANKASCSLQKRIDTQKDAYITPISAQLYKLAQNNLTNKRLLVLGDNAYIQVATMAGLATGALLGAISLSYFSNGIFGSFNLGSISLVTTAKASGFALKLLSNSIARLSFFGYLLGLSGKVLAFSLTNPLTTTSLHYLGGAVASALTGGVIGARFANLSAQKEVGITSNKRINEAVMLGASSGIIGSAIALLATKVIQVSYDLFANKALPVITIAFQKARPLAAKTLFAKYFYTREVTMLLLSSKSLISNLNKQLLSKQEEKK